LEIDEIANATRNSIAKCTYHDAFVVLLMTALSLLVNLAAALDTALDACAIHDTTVEWRPPRHDDVIQPIVVLVVLAKLQKYALWKKYDSYHSNSRSVVMNGNCHQT